MPAAVSHARSARAATPAEGLQLSACVCGAGGVGPARARRSDQQVACSVHHHVRHDEPLELFRVEGWPTVMCDQRASRDSFKDRAGKHLGAGLAATDHPRLQIDARHKRSNSLHANLRGMRAISIPGECANARNDLRIKVAPGVILRVSHLSHSRFE